MRLARSMLFVPASQPAMIAKAAASAADAVCIDLEDSVAIDEKPAARATAARAFRELDFGRRTRLLRINALDTPFTYRDVIEVVEAAGDRLDLIMLPKAGGPEDVLFLDKLLTQIETARGFTRPIGIEAQIESAEGLFYIREIAPASPRLEALIFGPGDYAASMRMPAESIGEFDAFDLGYPGHRWHAAMHTIVAAARANKLRAIDGPYAGYRDAAGFERSCFIARSMGFDGKQCIHPAQLAAVNGMFTPSAEEVAHAQRVVRACEEAAAVGRGVTSLDGRMVDAASIRMARVTLERHALCEENRNV